VAAHTETTLLYEAPHHLVRTVTDLAAACGPDRPVVLARELTKLHEEVWSGDLAAAADHLATTPPRGEYTLVLGGAPEVAAAEASDAMIAAALERELAGGATRRSAVDAVAAALGVPRKRVYALSLALD
jgi:16S rRNA (cytidine1402-2'-O)-methyltransferase